MTNGHPTVAINDISKSFGEFTAVNKLSLSVYPGRIYGLLGPNGAGKTTTIRMIVNITAPDSGDIKVFGQQITPELQDRNPLGVARLVDGTWTTDPIRTN